MRHVHGAARRRGGQVLPDARGPGRRRTRSRRSRRSAGDGAASRCSRRSRTRTALQCGYCTPGFLMTAIALRARGPGDPARGDPRGARRRAVPLHRLREHRDRRRAPPGRGWPGSSIAETVDRPPAGSGSARSVDAPRGRPAAARRGPLHRRPRPAARRSTWPSRAAPTRTPASSPSTLSQARALEGVEQVLLGRDVRRPDRADLGAAPDARGAARSSPTRWPREVALYEGQPGRQRGGGRPPRRRGRGRADRHRLRAAAARLGRGVAAHGQDAPVLHPEHAGVEPAGRRTRAARATPRRGSPRPTSWSTTASAINRVSGLPMETRAVVAEWRPGRARARSSHSTQAPHLVRKQLAETLRFAEGDVRVIAHDVRRRLRPQARRLPRGRARLPARDGPADAR